jgi:hypothetical protein
MTPISVSTTVRDLEIPLDRDVFMRTLIRELAGSLEDVVGLAEASGFVTVVGQAMGDQFNQQYRSALGVPALTREQVAEWSISSGAFTASSTWSSRMTRRSCSATPPAPSGTR